MTEASNVEKRHCRFCGNTIKRDRRANMTAGKSPTGWTHDSVKWLGNRCPTGTRSAEPTP